MKMFSLKKEKKENMPTDWKQKNKTYLEQVQKFLDIADNIKEEKLKMSVIGQMLKCDEILTQLAEKEFNKYYEKGVNTSIEKNNSIKM